MMFRSLPVPAGLLALSAATLLASPVRSQSRLADVDPAVYPVSAFWTGAPPLGVNVADGSLVFAARSDAGNTLWATDGTESGTHIVAEIAPVSNSSWFGLHPMTRFGDSLIFALQADFGSEPWISNGTAAGTRPVIDLQPGVYGSNPRRFVEAGGLVYFLATPVDGRGLWVTDGTASGTRLVKRAGNFTNLDQAMLGAAPLGTGLVFDMQNDNGFRRLWVTDGSSVSLLTDSLEPWPPDMVHVLDGRYYFLATPSTGFLRPKRLWSTDGTEAGTTMVHPSFGPSGITMDYVRPSGASTSGGLWLTGSDGGSGVGIWFTDGTSAGTIPVTGTVGVQAEFMVELPNGRLLFRATDAVNGVELWSAERTPGGAAGGLIADLYPGSNSSRPYYMGMIGSEALLVVNVDLRKRALVLTDGTPGGTREVIRASNDDVNFGSPIGETHGRVVFTATSNDIAQPWVTDGTAQGTHLLKSLTTGARGSYFDSTASAGRRLLLQLGLSRIWTTDGTASGTSVFGTQIYNEHILTPTDGRWLSGQQSGWKVYRTDGTDSGTTFLAATRNQPLRGLATDDRIVFEVVGSLWTSDGTPGGTHAIGDEAPGSDPLYGVVMATLGDRFLLLHSDAATGYELWLTDGTLAGTRLIVDHLPGPDGFHHVYSESIAYAELDDGRTVLPLSDSVSGTELWVTDGTAGGTWLLEEIAAANATSNPEVLGTDGRRVYFSADDRVHGRELWVTDGTTANTFMLGDLRVGPDGSIAEGARAVVVGDKLLFTAFDAIHGEEPWISDGTLAGTHPLLDLAAGPVSSFPWGWSKLGPWHALFAAYRLETGYELWITDGTIAGTRMLPEPTPGPASSVGFRAWRTGIAVQALAEHGAFFAYPGRDEETGVEPWAYPVALTGAPWAHAFGTACAPSGHRSHVELNGPPMLGDSSFEILLREGPPRGVGLLLLATGFGEIPLPGGCTLALDDILIARPWQLDASGSASVRVPIPRAPWAVGLELGAQSLHLAPPWAGSIDDLHRAPSGDGTGTDAPPPPPIKSPLETSRSMRFGIGR